MQTKSQGAQNPGLWVNGNRMPTNLNEMFPPGQEQDDAEANSPMPGSQAETDNNKRKAAAELAAKVAANKKAQDEKKDDDDEKNDTADNDVFVEAGKVDPRFVQPPRKRREKLYPSDDGLSPYSDNSEELGTDNSGKRRTDHSYISAKKQREMEASTDPAVLEKVRLRKERKERLDVRKKAEKEKQRKERKSIFDTDRSTDRPKKPLTPEEQKKQDKLSELIKGAGKSGKSGNGIPERIPDWEERRPYIQENTNRSMFLTHLQGMQTKSQDAQNPGLWVNGNRMPMHENSRLRKIMKDDIEKSNLSWTPRDERVARRLNDTIAPGVGDTQKRKSDIQTLVNRKKILAGAQDLNADGQVSKAEKELVTPQMVEVPDIDQLYPNRTQEDFLNHFLALNDRFNRPNINPDS